MRQGAGTVTSVEAVRISRESWSDAASTALARVSESISALLDDEVLDAYLRTRDGQIAGFRVDVRVALAIEHGSHD